MDTWKCPPREKVFEALSAIADGRVKLTGATTAEVVSSSGSKSYQIEWTPDFTAIVSNDNASYWQGYLGYPIIAILMQLGRLRYAPEVASLLSGIPWKQLNQQFRNDYSKAVSSVLATIEAKGVPSQPLIDEVNRILEDIRRLNLRKLPLRKKPPKEAPFPTQQGSLPF